MIGASVEGGRRLAAELTQAGARRGKSAAAQTAEQLRAEAAALAPGRLGAALRTEALGDGAQVTAPGYAAFVEFGTRKRAARPFLRPAIERMRALLRAGGRGTGT